MSATSCYRWQPPLHCLISPTFSPKPKSVSQPKPNEELQNAIHTTLVVHNRDTREPVWVSVVDGSKGTKVRLNLMSTDTIGKLQQEYLKLRPELVGSLNMVYSGKPVEMEKTLCELGMKNGAEVLTYQKCHGG